MTNEELIKLWKEALVLDEYRNIYNGMNKDQKKIVLFALKYSKIDTLEGVKKK